MWLILQHASSEDFVIATGKAHSVRDFAQVAFDHVGLDWKRYVKSDRKLLRPAEVSHLLGDASKASRVLGWKPAVSFEGLARMMVDADMERLRHGRKKR